MSADHQKHYNNMKLAKFFYKAHQKPLIISFAVLWLIVIAELILILMLNSGHFIYTLDDPYIHLSLAEKIQMWHYGINSNEFSAPSSSILWPFILVPFSSTMLGEFFPFIINVISAMGTLFLFWKIPEKSTLVENIKIRTNTIIVFLLLLMLGTNLAGLIFTGMEHSLQLLLVVLIIWKLIAEIEGKKVCFALALPILIAPLVRYENLAVSLAALVYLFLRKYYKRSILLATMLMLLVGGFSIFLLNLGLRILPTSVFVKSTFASADGNVETLLGHLKGNFINPRGVLLVAGMMSFISFILLSKERKEEKILAGSIAFAIALHLLIGEYGAYNRYEIYIWTVSILVMLYIGRYILLEIQRRNSFFKVAVLAILWAVSLSTLIIHNLATIPIASNNIYEQQYQMHRFAVDFYKKPVAVNDLGYVSYRNKNYVLDLAGLASLDALSRRKHSVSPSWMDELSKEHNVQLAMIYDDWFDGIPDNWHKIGELHLGKKQITPARRYVSFYVFNVDSYEEVYRLITEFRWTLPNGVQFKTEK
jgi:hypothetical protein